MFKITKTALSLPSNNSLKEIMMRTTFTRCLLIGTLAIGMSSNAMAEKYGKSASLCDETTLIGLYHFSDSKVSHSIAGELKFNGNGTGEINFKVKFPQHQKRQQHQD